MIFLTSGVKLTIRISEPLKNDLNQFRGFFFSVYRKTEIEECAFTHSVCELKIRLRNVMRKPLEAV